MKQDVPLSLLILEGTKLLKFPEPLKKKRYDQLIVVGSRNYYAGMMEYDGDLKVPKIIW